MSHQGHGGPGSHGPGPHEARGPYRDREGGEEHYHGAEAHHHHGHHHGDHVHHGEPHHHGDHHHGHQHAHSHGGGQPGPQNVDLELSRMLGDRASGMSRDIFMEVLRDAVKEEIRKMPELSALVAQAARELSEDIRLSLQIEELIARRDEGRKNSKAELLAALLRAGGPKDG